ncbi:TPA: hypothetical protein MBF06_001110 [Klebsiella aerogenes]|nr:hypothetical protein [Klebsiella aerogenes]MCB8448162.1 hypothetical protein [Klebsiella aerogenes]MCB8452365.1 hypothetical protein [Klebsiella aerogenes]HBT3042419.1 hypothetical protein [Klebsiella aerogenes]HBV4839533.1 hypothetical protein [Klebsiella aerogenes]
MKIDHDFGYFLDPNKMASIANYEDESAALLKLMLIHEDFLRVVIENLRPEGSEKYNAIQSYKYFAPKLSAAVLLGLPVSLADAMAELNSIRNKYAHKIDYEITNEEVDKLAEVIKKIKIEEINLGVYIHQEVDILLKDGIYAIALMRELPPDLEENRLRICKLVTSAHCMCLLGAFWLINTLHVKGKLKLSMPE